MISRDISLWEWISNFFHIVPFWKDCLNLHYCIEPICGCKIDEEICSSASQCICWRSQKKGDFCTKIEMPTKGNLEDFAKQWIDDDFEPLVYNTKRN